MALDVTNPDAVEWFVARLKRLQEITGIDGFKFDAGQDMLSSLNEAVVCVPTKALACPICFCALVWLCSVQIIEVYC